MKRCPACGVLRPDEGPCPGCLVELGLQTPRWRWAGFGFAAATVMLLPTAVLVALSVGLALEEPRGSTELRADAEVPLEPSEGGVEVARAVERAAEAAVSRRAVVGETRADLAYASAVRLSQSGEASGALQAAERALHGRSTWTGSTYVSRVHTLYGIQQHALTTLYGPEDGRTLDAARQLAAFVEASGLR